VIESYPGHSGTDVVLRVPEQNVVYAGDLLFSNMYPVTFDTQATVSGWRQNVEDISLPGTRTLSSFPVMDRFCGQEGIALLRALFDDIEEQAQKMHKGRRAGGRRPQIFTLFRKNTRTSPFFAWDFSIAPTITKLYTEWGAK